MIKFLDAAMPNSNLEGNIAYLSFITLITFLLLIVICVIFIIKKKNKK